MSFILAIECSDDPLIIELRQSFLTADHLGTLDTVFDALSTAKASVSIIKSATLRPFQPKEPCSMENNCKPSLLTLYV